jgi:hypothetical protein
MVEVRPSRMHKGLAVPWLREQLGAGARLLAFGDDLTDEDLFRELGVVDEPVLVGAPRRSRGRWRLADPAAVTALLGWIAATRRGEAAAAPPMPEPLTAQPRGAGSVHGRYELLVVSNWPDRRAGRSHRGRSRA